MGKIHYFHLNFLLFNILLKIFPTRVYLYYQVFWLFFLGMPLYHSKLVISQTFNQTIYI